jgi:glycine/D-amino acid oxidase-like deaminating enzyme/nitrite reductase/ring-hydroxylating ferredoxin subunit
MKTDGGNKESIWASTADIAPRPELAEDLNTNVCVIGAGIAGLSTAYLLAREGKSVVVLDDGPIAGGETGRTTAHLSNALDDRYFEIERLHGERGARLAAESHTAAIDRIEQIVVDENIDCDFSRVDGYLLLQSGQNIEYLEEELEAARRAGVDGVRMLDRAPIERYDSGACLHFPHQGQFHIVKYMAGLADAAERLGVRIFTRTHVEDIRKGEHPVVVSREGRSVKCNHVVVATNTPINDWVTIHTKQEAYRTYVIGALVPKGAVPKILLWDTADPYHYVRTQPLSNRHDVLIVGGEDHKTGQAHNTASRFGRLESWARQLFPMIEFVEFQWSGQIMEPVDSLAFIGRNPGDENIFIATGDSGHGMTHGTIAGMLIRDLIDNCDNAWAKLYDPSRKTLKSAGEFARANLNVARQYLDFVTGGQVKSTDQITPGSGAVIRRGVQKVAAYRDEAGELHEFSAICPHLGCIVDWNDTEKSWDCPCHGSRFTAEGKVINGPANSDLSPTEDEEPLETMPATH